MLIWRIRPTTPVLNLERIYGNDGALDVNEFFDDGKLPCRGSVGEFLRLQRISMKPLKSLPLRHFSFCYEGPDFRFFLLLFFLFSLFKHLLSQGHNANGQGTLFSSEQMPAGRQIPQGLLGKCGREFRSINTLLTEHLPWARLSPGSLSPGVWGHKGLGQRLPPGTLTSR